MVELPGSLERSTLGDVLGALHRSRCSGALRLDPSDGSARHVIHLHEGLIHRVEWAGVSASLDTAPERERCLEQLEALFGLSQARISFRVMGPRAARTPEPLRPPEFLHGRQRRRDRDGEGPNPVPASETARDRALSRLGLSADATEEQVRAAFRRLARRWHPDRHPTAGDLTRAALCRRFAEIAAAYQELMVFLDAERAPARAANAR
ncbi:MAG TPA: DnaJ domain-containing protein [Polyangiaceae bacterium]|nr:DnaJ domain-containing protein [Polyangiaceae bacterium]